MFVQVSGKMQRSNSPKAWREAEQHTAAAHVMDHLDEANNQTGTDQITRTAITNGSPRPINHRSS
jgi:hypothetical protein